MCTLITLNLFPGSLCTLAAFLVPSLCKKGHCILRIKSKISFDAKLINYVYCRIQNRTLHNEHREQYVPVCKAHYKLFSAAPVRGTNIRAQTVHRVRRTSACVARLPVCNCSGDRLCKKGLFTIRIDRKKSLFKQFPLPIYLSWGWCCIATV